MLDDVVYLKNSLISRIQSSTDLNFLKALQTIFDSSEKELFKLTDEQKGAIEQGRQDIKAGRSQTHDAFMKETEEWLNKL